MKKRRDPFEDNLIELSQIANALRDEGEQESKTRYAVFVAENLVSIKFGLHRICLALFGLLGLVAGKFLFGGG